MQITLRFFALIRERIGESQRVLALPAGSRVRDVSALLQSEFPDLAPLFRTSMIMRNQEYVDPDEEIAEGDEIAIIPPVSGGADDHVRVHHDVLDAAEIAALVERPGAGAIVTFAGAVRDNARGRAVLWLDYEAYPEAAEKMLSRIIGEMRER